MYRQKKQQIREIMVFPQSCLFSGVNLHVQGPTAAREKRLELVKLIRLDKTIGVYIVHFV